MNNGVLLETNTYRMLKPSQASQNMITMYPDNQAVLTGNHGMIDPKKKLGIRRGGLPDNKQVLMMPYDKMVNKPFTKEANPPNVVYPSVVVVGNPVCAS